MRQDVLDFLKTKEAYTGMYNSSVTHNHIKLYTDVIKALDYTNYADTKLIECVKTYLAPDTYHLNNADATSSQKARFIEHIWIRDSFGIAPAYIASHIDSDTHTFNEMAFLITRIIEVNIVSNWYINNFIKTNLHSFLSYLCKHKEHIDKPTLTKSMLLLEIEDAPGSSNENKIYLNRLYATIKPNIKQLADYLYGTRAEQIIQTAETLGVKNVPSFWLSALTDEPGSEPGKLPFEIV